MAGSRVLDLGAGPGHATVDLAEIVGASGEVAAVERAPHFVSASRRIIDAKGLTNVTVHELDLAKDELPAGEFDFVWSRLVAGFIRDLPGYVRKIGAALRRGGCAIFHEFAQYDTWRFSPASPLQERFVAHLVSEHRRRVGRVNAALLLLPLLAQHGCVLRATTPHIFCLRPDDPMWEWPITFSSAIATGENLTFAAKQFVQRLAEEFATLKSNPNARMITPMILEIVAEKT